MIATNNAILSIPKDQWEDLANLLRQELQEYGGFLVLLNQQQKCILKQDADQLRQLEHEIQNQINSTQIIKNRRVDMVASISEILGNEADASLSELLPSFPSVAQPMLEALINEINSLIAKTRKVLRQNHMLLSRASEVTEKILTALNPKPTTKVYTRRGNISFKTASLGSCIRTSA
jgi:flagellar biosynthesis/type III secretory pathway chaperone